MFNKKKSSTIDDIEDNSHLLDEDNVKEVQIKVKKKEYGEETNPSANRAFLEIYGIHANNAKKWQRISMVCLAITAFSIVWAAKVSTGIKYIPVVFEKSDIGQLTPLGVLKNKNLQVNEDVIVGQIYTYVINLRQVIQDLGLEKTRRSQLLLTTADTDRDKINSLFLKQLSDAGQDGISVEITQIIPIRTSSRNAWKVTWNESYNSTPESIKRYEAIFSIAIDAVTSNNPNEIAMNPTGIQIGNFTMSQIFDGSSNSTNKSGYTN